MSIENNAIPPKSKPPKGPKREKRPPKKITEKYLYNAGLAYLQRFPASTAHFRTVMMRKIDRSCRHHTDQSREDSIALLDKTIEKFQSLALLDDEGYTRGMITSLRARGASARAIHAKLQQKGLKPDIIQDTLKDIDNENDDEDAELAAALKFARRKKLGPYCTKDTPEDKQLATLARAGFSYDICKKIITSELE